jgi:hypothetical protein
MAFIIADKVINEVCEAVGVDPMRCQRVIIDLQVQHIPLVYVQMIGDDNLLTVTPPVAEMAKVVLTSNQESRQS